MKNCPPYPVIPLTFDDSLSYLELTSKALGGVNLLAETKQDKLIAGEHIKIEDGVISTSAIDGAYVNMKDNTSGGVDLRVDFDTRTLAKQADLQKNEETTREHTSSIASLTARVGQAERDVEQIAGTQIPSSVVQNAVTSYVNAHSGEFATKTELNNVKATIEDFTVPSKNLFNRDDRKTGFKLSNTGEAVTGTSTQVVSDFMPVTPGSHYMSDYANKTPYTVARACFYTAGKVFLSYLDNVNQFDAPSGAYYVRVQLTENRADFYQLEQGSVMTPFSEYLPRVNPEALPEDYIRSLVSGVVYVATNGLDDNDGSKSAPFATLTHAIESGASMIYVLPGEYHEHIRITRLSNYTPHLIIWGYGATFSDVDGGDGAIIDIRLGNVDIYGVKTSLSPSFKDEIKGQTRIPNLSGFFIAGCHANLVDCEAHNMVYMGFRLDGSTVSCHRCLSEANDVDGFNAHNISFDNVEYESDVSLFHCSALNNGDDGFSTHEHSRGFVDGGEFSGNVQAGIAPYAYAMFRIQNAVIRDNRYGVQAFDSSSHTGETTEVFTIGNVLIGNKVGLYANYYDILSCKDVFANNEVNVNSGAFGHVTVYN